MAAKLPARGGQSQPDRAQFEPISLMYSSSNGHAGLCNKNINGWRLQQHARQVRQSPGAWVRSAKVENGHSQVSLSEISLLDE